MLTMLDEESRVSLQAMASKKFRSLRNNVTLTIAQIVDQAHFTNVFHWHDRHNVQLHSISSLVTARDWVVLVALCGLAPLSPRQNCPHKTSQLRDQKNNCNENMVRNGKGIVTYSSIM